MTRVVFIKPDKLGASCVNITRELKNRGVKALVKKNKNSKYKNKNGDLIINWGNSDFEKLRDINGNAVIFLQNPANVANSINKLKAFDILKESGVSIPPYTKSETQVMNWLNDGKMVFGRKKLTGTKGDGIVIMEDTGDFIECPLYTQYIKKKFEYRVHVFRNQVIDVTQKKKKYGVDSPNKGLIRNMDNGWVYAHEDIDVTDDLKTIAINACKALGLAFGAVDIIYNSHYNKYYVLEVNTAPAVINTKTISAYAEAIHNYIGE